MGTTELARWDGEVLCRGRLGPAGGNPTASVPIAVELPAPFIPLRIGRPPLRVQNRPPVYPNPRSRFRHVCRKLTSFGIGKIVCVLAAPDRGPEVNNGSLWINWCQRRELFAFDAIEILQATDDDVERFCIQVGNDTHLFSQEQSSGLECVVRTRLADNTMRILRRTFNSVHTKR